MNVQFIEANGVPAFAVLPMEDFNKLVDPLEDAIDALTVKQMAADIASGKEKTYPQEVVEAILGGASPVRILREYRHMSRANLALACGVTTAHIYQIESGKRSMSVDVLRKMSKALDVDMDMLI